jgi:hypothetical protein
MGEFKMKYIFFTFAILQSFFAFSNDQSFTDSQQQICHSIKQLQSGTGFDKYLAKAQELKQNKLSTCSCVNFLLGQRKQKYPVLIALLTFNANCKH